MNDRSVPAPTIRRLPAYLRCLKSLDRDGIAMISCTEIARRLELESTQIRKDLAHTGVSGRTKVGFAVGELIGAIEAMLGWDHFTDAVLIGVGNLGRALIGYSGLRANRIRIRAAFDRDQEQVGRLVQGLVVRHIDQASESLRGLEHAIGILAVPASSAQEACDLLTACGLTAIWNFAPTHLQTDDMVVVEDVDLTASLAWLSHRAATRR